ncbi:hypothetical protein [Staphylococcus marylandisciuri]|uniref:hypothetical protein n=1 Tax=Staphylococcus marylandisciuri TaxID=2981529 RepID=UPI0021D19F47|nr:hypothetical protein [Staphylococcus marylandisciuri]
MCRGPHPHKEKLVNQFQQAQQVGAGLRNPFIQIRFLSRSRIAIFSIDDLAFGRPLICFLQDRNFIPHPHYHFIRNLLVS